MEKMSGGPSTGQPENSMEVDAEGSEEDTNGSDESSDSSDDEGSAFSVEEESEEEVPVDCDAGKAVEGGGQKEKVKRKVYLPGLPIKDDEVLVHDPSSYVMLHEANAGIPCLSFDVIRDDLGDERSDYPQTAYIVTGTQADRKNRNNITVIKMSNLTKTLKSKEEDDDDSDSSSSSEEENEGVSSKEPIMYSSSISHFGCVNRIRCSTHNDTVYAAVWSETGRVSIWDMKKHIKAVENPSSMKVRSLKKKSKRKPPTNTEYEGPVFTFTGHTTEGFAIDWSKTTSGILATGDCRNNVHIWKPQESTWHVDLRPLKGHSASVEDLQWSPTESNVLASCSVDKSLKIWDIRSPTRQSMLTLNDAHTSDVNVISWNNKEPLIISGGDDGYLHVWDLRDFKSDSAIATFKYHTGAISTVEWHPTDSSVFASGGEDDQIALWDLAVERDVEDDEEEIKEVPPQLLFIHLGQKAVKELHWHPQIPGAIISTAENGFNIFKTISV